MASFVDTVFESSEALYRMTASTGGVFVNPFNKIAVITSVNDPLGLGRVQVTFANEEEAFKGWIYVLGHDKGKLSTQFLHRKCVVGNVGGNSANSFVIGLFNDNIDEPTGSPIQVAKISTQAQKNDITNDGGVSCNQANEGKIYLFESEINHDLKICIRRNNTQEEGKDLWSWKSLTHGLAIEKGFDPAGTNPQTTDVTDLKSTAKPKCDKSTEGETLEYSEDRKFRTTTIICRKDENGAYDWVPISAPPVVFRTTLPKCSEKTHGVEAVLDSGRDSQLAVCLRYQGSMKWVHHKTREPIQFHSEPVPTMASFIAGAKPIQALSPQAAGLPGGIGQIVRDVVGQGVPGLASGGGLGSILSAAGVTIPPGLPSQILQSVSTAALAAASGASVQDIASQLVSANAGQIDSALSSILGNGGGLGNIIANGIRSGNLDQALREGGTFAINAALNELSPEIGSVFSGYMSGGVLGAIDSAVLVGLDQLPPEVSKFVGPLVSMGSDFLRGQPVAINKILDAAVGNGNDPLGGVIGQFVNLAGGQGGISNLLGSGVLESLGSGGLGPIAQSLGDFSNLPGITALGGFSGVPQLATTGLELLGQGQQFADLLGKMDGSFSVFSNLTGNNPISAVLNGVPGLGGLLGGGGGGKCPCDPKCRKTGHGADSDGMNLLESCGAVVATSASSFNPTGDPTKNNENPIAEVLGLINTKIGSELCTPNLFDLTAMLELIEKLGGLADRMQNAKHADWPEWSKELEYTLELIGQALKQADNNITGIESIERKLIDVQHNFITKMLIGEGSFFSKNLLAIINTSKAVKDLYAYVAKLDKKKKGKFVGVFATSSLKTVFENITKIATLKTASKAEGVAMISKVVKPADAEWRKLQPGIQEVLDITSLILGAIPKDIGSTFGKCKTKRNKNAVLKNSLESKVNSPTRASDDVENSLFGYQLPAGIVENQLLDDNRVAIGDSITGTVGGSGGGGGGGDDGSNNITTAAATAARSKVVRNILKEVEFNKKRAETGTTDGCE